MNRASETVIRWLMLREEVQSDITAALIEALYDGCEKGEDDAVQMRDHLLNHAIESSKKLAEHYAFVHNAVVLHFEIERLKRDENNLAHLNAIHDILKDVPESGLARRACVLKAKQHVDQLESCWRTQAVQPCNIAKAFSHV